MKLLLVGANGQVGTELQRSLAPLGTVVAATRNGTLADGGICEIADFDAPDDLSALVERVAPDIVVNAAAYTAVDRAEDDLDAAFRANAQGPRVLAAACAARDALLVHYSTDYVFDGSGTRAYREDDATAPLGVYGASKREGECAIQSSGVRHMIFRTAWVYAAHGKNFLLTMLRLARERDELRVVADQIGTPTSAALIADVTAAVLGRPPGVSGIWNLTATGHTSWHGFAEGIVDRAHAAGILERIPRVLPIATSDYPTRAQRPAYSVLDMTRLQRDFGLSVPSWDRVLDDVVAEIEVRR
ncbi:MAG: dTDP-4-dehydrorhamnose reductase [Luteimonas sp.]